jgi:hypothetical protein
VWVRARLPEYVELGHTTPTQAFCGPRICASDLRTDLGLWTDRDRSRPEDRVGGGRRRQRAENEGWSGWTTGNRSTSLAGPSTACCCRPARYRPAVIPSEPGRSKCRRDGRPPGYRRDGECTRPAMGFCSDRASLPASRCPTLPVRLVAAANRSRRPSVPRSNTTDWSQPFRTARGELRCNGLRATRSPSRCWRFSRRAGLRQPSRPCRSHHRARPRPTSTTNRLRC